jgi:HSP20 family protein
MPGHSEALKEETTQMFATFHVPRTASRGWDPFELARREFARSCCGNGNDGGRAATRAFAPLSVWEDAQQLYVEVDLPGLKPGDVEVTVNDGKLFIRGERVPAQREPACRHDERSYGKFERIVALPETIDPSKVDANLRDGVLLLTLQKRPEVLPQKVTVKYGSGAQAGAESA